MGGATGGAAVSPGICCGEIKGGWKTHESEVAVVALVPEDCGTAMHPSNGGRVVAEPTVGTWLECSENPAVRGGGWRERGRGWGERGGRRVRLGELR